MSWLFDTCAVSAYIARDPRKRPPELVSLWATAQEGGICLSSVTLYELRRGLRSLRLKDGGRRREVDLEKLLRTVTVLALDDWTGNAWRVAAELWANGRHLKPSLNVGELDLLIAATALANDRVLVTLDRGLWEALTRLGHAERVRWVATPEVAG